MGTKGKRPGVMVYFDLRTSLKCFSLEDKGVLFDAILAYAEDGDLPCFDGALEVAWGFIQPRIDADAERYESISKSRSAAGRKSHEKHDGDTPSKETNAALAASAANSKQIISTQLNTSQTNSSQLREKEADKPPRAPRFSPPTVEDVMGYCLEKGYSVDASAFVDFYESKGWKVGREGMRDWKAAVRNWQRREDKEPAKKGNSRSCADEDYRAGW